MIRPRHSHKSQAVVLLHHFHVSDANHRHIVGTPPDTVFFLYHRIIRQLCIRLCLTNFSPSSFLCTFFSAIRMSLATLTVALLLIRINPHEAKENIHLRPTSISRTLFRFFSFSGTSVGLSKSRDTAAAQKKELTCPIQRATMLACTIGAAAPIGAVLYHHTYIGPILVIPPR
jgi:hypothetical protein